MFKNVLEERLQDTVETDGNKSHFTLFTLLNVIFAAFCTDSLLGYLGKTSLKSMALKSYDFII